MEVRVLSSAIPVFFFERPLKYSSVRRIPRAAPQRFCRIAYHLVAGKQVFRHPCLRERGWILDKLLASHIERGTPWPTILADLQEATKP